MTRSNLPIPVGKAYTVHDEAVAASKAGVFDAQLYGQTGQKRGLKGGPPVLDAARAAYLEAEYSGEADRRLLPGLITRSNI